MPSSMSSVAKVPTLFGEMVRISIILEFMLKDEISDDVNDIADLLAALVFLPFLLLVRFFLPILAVDDGSAELVRLCTGMGQATSTDGRAALLIVNKRLRF